MVYIAAVYGSPRRDGNSAILLDQAVEGARSQGAHVEEIFLRNYKISPCLELYNCLKTGRCAIEDDFPNILGKLERCDGIMLASPIFFYTVSAHTKLLMDRCQSLWVRKNLRGETISNKPRRKGIFLSVGATQGKKLFDGAVLTVKYFFDVFDADLHETVLCRGVDRKGEVLKHDQYLTAAYAAGVNLSLELKRDRRKT